MRRISAYRRNRVSVELLTDGPAHAEFVDECELSAIATDGRVRPFNCIGTADGREGGEREPKVVKPRDSKPLGLLDRATMSKEAAELSYVES